MHHYPLGDVHVLMPMDQLKQNTMDSLIMKNDYTKPVPNGSFSCDIVIVIFNLLASTSISR